MSSPQRAFERRLRPIGQAILGADIEPLVRTILRRIRRIARNTQAGAYVLADAGGYVYVLAEQSSTTESKVRRELAMVVGLYASRRVFPDEEQLRMDLIAHFLEVGYITPAMIYELVGRDLEHSPDCCIVRPSCIWTGE